MNDDPLQAPVGDIPWVIYRVKKDGTEVPTGKEVIEHTYFAALQEAATLLGETNLRRIKLYAKDSEHERAARDAAQAKRIETGEVTTRTYSVRIELQITEHVGRKATDVKRWIQNGIDDALSKSPFYADRRVDVVGDIDVKEVLRKKRGKDEW